MTTTAALNPFDVTKAVDLDDRQIQDYWVDLPGGAGFRELVRPTSPMPMFVLGGKGSGKTHILRYFSFPLQRLRSTSPLEAVRTDGFVGIYLRCGGLNASRFAGKGQSADAWSGLFQQYMDLWLAQLFLEVLAEVLPQVDRAEIEGELCSALTALHDRS